MSNQNRVAIIDGLRTPFVKAGGAFAKYRFQELGAHVLKGLVERNKLTASNLDEFSYGTVLLDPRTPNWAREILFAAGLPKSIYAQSISNNCISGLISLTSVAERIQLGKTRSAIAGGVESMSMPTLTFSYKSASKFLALFRARSFADKAKIALSLRPSDFAPQAPAVTEPSTGLTMGQHMEITAKQMSIAREEQDLIAFNSHQNAAQAISQGLLDNEILAFAGVSKDNIVRADTTREKLAKLKPAFDRSEKGTLTAGNSSPLTDGASAVLVAAESFAKEQGWQALAYIKDYEYSAIDPNDGLLMAPAVAVPRMLKRNGLMLEDFDLIEIHEAFAAQVLANIVAWEKNGIGKVDRSKLNVNGGSIALGHPFAATGGRIVTSLAHELKRRGAKRGLISICAAGATAGAMIVER